MEETAETLSERTKSFKAKIPRQDLVTSEFLAAAAEVWWSRADGMEIPVMALQRNHSELLQADSSTLDTTTRSERISMLLVSADKLDLDPTERIALSAKPSQSKVANGWK